MEHSEALLPDTLLVRLPEISFLGLLGHGRHCERVFHICEEFSAFILGADPILANNGGILVDRGAEVPARACGFVNLTCADITDS